MNIEQRLQYQNSEYIIIHSEQEFMIHPAALRIIPLNTAALQCSFQSSFQIIDYRLCLDKLLVGNHNAVNIGGTGIEKYAQQHEFPLLPIAYNGTILIASKPVREYMIKGEKAPACFSYEKSYELVFENGILITSIDHSRAMLRIRKNLELGLRNLNKSRDLHCIKRFMNSRFVGNYKPFRFGFSRMDYIKEMKKDNSSIEPLEQQEPLIKIS